MDDITINGINFTERELDIISCIISGNTAKSIAFLLDISPNTVNVHTRNIIFKIGGASKNDLVKFIEKSQQYKTLRDRYDYLGRLKQFNNVLKEIAVTIHREAINYNIVAIKNSSVYDRLADDLSTAGINISSECEPSYNGTKIICSDNVQDFNKYGAKSTIYFTKESLSSTNEFLIIEYKQDYFFAVLRCIDEICGGNEKVREIISSFPKKEEQTNEVVSQEKAVNESDIQESIPTKFSKHYKSFLVMICIVAIFIVSIRIFAPLEGIRVKSNVPVIFENVFLERLDIEDKIRKAFGSEKIKTAILVGDGGIGKTTIARHYLKTQKSEIIFEINAENQNTLWLSMYKFASLLAITTSQREELKFIKEIENEYVKRENLLHFISSRLKERGEWCILFDNVEDFSIISDCFPHDPDIWGNGKVIITTRNSNVGSVNFLNTEKIIKVDLLTAEEKAKLFNKIVGKHVPNEDELLDKIPSMPLDVSVAAHYIKACNISANDYLNTLHNASFDLFKKSLLKNITGYSNTRYSIVTTSFEKIIKENPVNRELLIMLSMLDSQNISRWYFSRYCDEATATAFIMSLKQYSLIHEKTGKFFVHRSTQEICRTYLFNSLSNREKEAFIEKIVKAMTPYECLQWYLYDKQERQMSYKQINEIIPHLEHLKENIFSLEIKNKEKYNIQILLALMYAYTADASDQKIREMAENIIQNNNGIIKDYDYVALLLEYVYMGIKTPTNKDEKILKKCISMCNELKSSHLLAMTYLYLAQLYCEKNETELCKHFLSESMRLAVTQKTKMLLNYRYCDIVLSLCVSKKEVQDVINFTLETLHALNADHFFFRTNEEYGDLEGAAKNCIVALRRILVRVYNYVEQYDLATENYKEASFFYKNRRDKGEGNPINKEDLLETEYANTLIRTGQLTQAEKKLEMIIHSGLKRKYHDALFKAFTYLSEVKIRLDKLEEAYGACLSALKYRKESESNFEKLMGMLLCYHMAVIKYKQYDIDSSMKHFRDFMRQSKSLCSSYLDIGIYEQLFSENVFDVDSDDINIYIKNSREILAIIYGETNSFIRDFVDKIR